MTEQRRQEKQARARQLKGYGQLKGMPEMLEAAQGGGGWGLSALGAAEATGNG